MQLPLGHKDTKNHKDLIIRYVYLVNLSALVTLWQKTNLRNSFRIGML